MEKRWKIAGIDFEHFHMGDNLRMAHEHPAVDIVGTVSYTHLRAHET